MERASSGSVNLKSTSTFACVSVNLIYTRTFEIPRHHANIPLTRENFYTSHLQSGNDFLWVYFSLTPDCVKYKNHDKRTKKDYFFMIIIFELIKIVLKFQNDCLQ